MGALSRSTQRPRAQTLGVKCIFELMGRPELRSSVVPAVLIREALLDL